MAQGQGLGDGLNFSENSDGNVQLTKDPRKNQPKFMNPTKETQGISPYPIIPSWLSNLVSKKRKLQPVSTPVKDIITKYVAHRSKVNRLKVMLT